MTIGPFTQISPGSPNGTISPVSGFFNSNSVFGIGNPIDPNFFVAYYNLGMALNLTGRPGETVTLMQSLIEKSPRNYKAYNMLGQAYFEMKDYEKAKTLFIRSIEIYPYYASSRANLGAAYTRMKRYEDAREHFEVAVRLDPDNSGYKKNLAEIVRVIEKIKK